MNLDAQVHKLLQSRFLLAGAGAPCCSHGQFENIVRWVTEIATMAEEGHLRDERLRSGTPQPVSAMGIRELHFLFDGPPRPQGPRLINVLDPDGREVDFGDWRKRSNGMWEFVVQQQFDSSVAARVDHPVPEPVRASD